MGARRLRSGDRVFHPTYGFGVIEGLTTRDQAGESTDYYGVRLSAGGMLTVPVTRADAVGLRRVVNGLSSIVACLNSPAHPLPDDARQRVAELNARWQAPQPAALVEAVRDLLNRSRDFSLTPGDKRWLNNACERLSAEAALVDAITLDEARTAIQREVGRFKAS